MRRRMSRQRATMNSDLGFIRDLLRAETCTPPASAQPSGTNNKTGSEESSEANVSQAAPYPASAARVRWTKALSRSPEPRR
jgi:hypothetical protein